MNQLNQSRRSAPRPAFAGAQAAQAGDTNETAGRRRAPTLSPRELRRIVAAAIG